MAVHKARRSILSLKSWLFTPASKADRFDRAAEVHADALIIDLEDAIALPDKQKARTAALQYLGQPAESRLPCALRINAPVTRTGIEDLHSLLESLAAPDYIILPKCDSPAFISMVRSLLDLAAKQTEIIALIESAKGVEALPDIVSSDVRPVALLFGAADMEAGLGAKTGSGKRCYLSDRASSRPPGSAGECSSSEPAVKNRIMIANVHASQGETG